MLGQRENPIPLGQEAQVGDWKITVTGATLDASGRATDATYEPLEAGSQVVLVDLTATYIGEDKKVLFKLWATGPMKPITKYGGLPKPTGCV